jgi:hypothetical protein
MPTVSLYYVSPVSAPDRSQIGTTVTDPSASVGTYESGTFHTISITGLTEAIDQATNQRYYWLEFTGESGANSVASKLSIMGGYAKFTATVIRP